MLLFLPEGNDVVSLRPPSTPSPHGVEGLFRTFENVQVPYFSKGEDNQYLLLINISNPYITGKSHQNNKI